MSPDEDPTVARQGVSGGRIILWIFVGIWLLYFGVFVLIYLDEVAIRTRWIQKSVAAISPELDLQCGATFRVIYSPLISAMKAMKLTPN